MNVMPTFISMVVSYTLSNWPLVALNKVSSHLKDQGILHNSLCQDPQFIALYRFPLSLKLSHMAICSYLVSWRPSKKLASALRPKKPKPTDALEVKLKSVPLVSKGKVVQSVAKSRILNELRKANDNPPTHCSYGLVGDDIFKLQGTIMGPSDTPFEGGVFFLSIEIPADYPFKPPKIKFQTKVYHPNVNKDGTIHVDILGNMWTPALGIEKMLLGICSLLPDPNAEDPHNPICQLYRNDRKFYNQMARQWTTKYAMR